MKKYFTQMHVCVGLVGIYLLLSVCTVHADEILPCHYTGTVKLDGKDVPAGTSIVATIRGKEYQAYTYTQNDGSSRYSVEVRWSDGEHYPLGEKVRFKVDTYNADQIGIFYAGGLFNLDLTASTSHSGPNNFAKSESSLDWWLIVVTFLLVMAFLGIIYYIMLIRRIANKNAPKYKRKV